MCPKLWTLKEPHQGPTWVAFEDHLGVSGLVLWPAVLESHLSDCPLGCCYPENFLVVGLQGLILFSSESFPWGRQPSSSPGVAPLTVIEVLAAWSGKLVQWPSASRKPLSTCPLKNVPLNWTHMIRFFSSDSYAVFLNWFFLENQWKKCGQCQYQWLGKTDSAGK